jgi:hypothetical protein
MYLKRYSIAAFIWMALVGWYIYAYVTQESMSLNFFGLHLPPLQIALWVVLVLAVLYLGSLFHMAFYAMLGKFKLRRYEKDFNQLIDAIIEAYLGKKKREYNFRTDRYKLLGMLLEKTTILPTPELVGRTGNEKIDNVLDIINRIKNGEVVDLKPFKLLPENPLVIENEKNRYLKGEVSAENILSNCTKHAEELCRFVYTDYTKKATISNIMKYKSYITKEGFFNILKRINAEDFKIVVSSKELLELMNRLELTRDDYIEISKLLSKAGMNPEERMKLFEIISDKKEDAMDAYLFTLFDLEMVTLANEILDNANPEEFQNFRAYRALKECGKNFSIYLFI